MHEKSIFKITIQSKFKYFFPIFYFFLQFSNPSHADVKYRIYLFSDNRGESTYDIDQQFRNNVRPALKRLRDENISFKEQIIIEGEIKKDDYKKILFLTKLMNGSNRFGNISLNSNGGNVNSAIKIGRLIRDLDLSVFVSRGKRCISSCIFLLASGVKRTVLNDSIIGIHSPYFVKINPFEKQVGIEIQRVHKKIKLYLDEMNINPQLYQMMMSIPPDEIYKLSKKEIKVLNLDGEDLITQEKDISIKAFQYNITNLEYRKINAVVGKKMENCMNGIKNDCRYPQLYFLGLKKSNKDAEISKLYFQEIKKCNESFKLKNLSLFDRNETLKSKKYSLCIQNKSIFIKNRYKYLHE